MPHRDMKPVGSRLLTPIFKTTAISFIRTTTSWLNAIDGSRAAIGSDCHYTVTV
jgi:hypothetical protein